MDPSVCRPFLRRLAAVSASLTLAAGLIPVASAASSSAAGYTSDLAVVAQGAGEADRGRSFTVTVSALNVGPTPAEDVTVELPLPMGLSFEQKGSDARCIKNDGKVRCSIPRLAQNGIETLPIAFRTPYHDVCSYFEYHLQFYIFSSSQNDPEPFNNVSAPWTVGIRCAERPVQCADEVDNDRDGLIDMEDPGCLSPTGDNEYQDLAPGFQRTRPSFSSSSLTGSSASRRPGIGSMFRRSSASSSSLRSRSSSSVRETEHKVRLSIESDLTTVRPGEAVPVSILVYNRSDVAQQGIIVSFSYDPEQLTIAAEGGKAEADAYAWSVDVPPRQTRTLRLTAAVLPSVPMGTTVAASARVQGAGNPVASLVLPVIDTLPQTGIGDFTRALPAGSSRFLRPAVGNGGSLITLLAVIAAGLGIGGGLFLGRNRKDA